MATIEDHAGRNSPARVAANRFRHGAELGAVAGGFLVVHARTWAPALPLALSGLVVAAAAGLASRVRLTGSIRRTSPAVPKEIWMAAAQPLLTAPP